MVLRSLTIRDEKFFIWLLDPKLFAERVTGPKKRHRKILSQAIRLLNKLPITAQITQSLELLKNEREWWEKDAQQRITVHRSTIQQRSQSGTGNIDITERLFLATLIARRRGPKPYKFVSDGTVKPWFVSPKAIETRVRRFERLLVTQGPMSCKHILGMKYHQFLGIRRSSRILRLLERYDQGKISFKRYSEELTRLAWPNRQECLWLDALCRHASCDTK